MLVQMVADPVVARVGGRDPRTRFTRFVLALLLAVAALLAPAASALAAQPIGVNLTLEGCRNSGNITLPNGSGQFVCPDAAYTTGNLGKGWNELDLVPFRLTSEAGNSAPPSQTYTAAVVLDSKDAGRPGYDVLSTLTKKSGSCTLTVGPETILAPGVGGIDESRYRLVTITQASDTVCVFDYYGRLALGSHLFPGSSLHANLANENLGTAGIGSRDVSIPVREIAPQELRKDMSASRDSDHMWSVTKSPTPAVLTFEDTCVGPSPASDAVQIRINYTRLPATPSGEVNILTHVYAKNPATRTITLNVTDQVYEGTAQTTLVGGPATSGAVDLPPNTELLVLTHMFSATNAQSQFNDVATATYTDKVTGVPIPGQTTASASATVQTGATTNTTATVVDDETLTGQHLSYSVDSTTPPLFGSFAPYLLGTKTTGGVTWTSPTLTGDGSVVFNKTVYVDEPAITTGTLDDTATLTGSDGFITEAAADVDISANALVSLKIGKTIPNILQGSETASFDFKVYDAATNEVAIESISFAAGETSKSVTVQGLLPGKYTVKEVPQSGWDDQPDASRTIDLPACSGEVSFANKNKPAAARVRKVTVPAGHEAGWTFTLNGPGATDDSVTTSGAGSVNFATALQEGSYTITETPKSGFDLTSASSECTFTVNYPADNERVFSCAYTNTQRGRIVVKKVTSPAGAIDTFGFTGNLSGDIGDGGSLSAEVSPGAYETTESVQVGWDLTSIVCNDGDSSGNVPTGKATYNVGPGETVTCTYTNTQRGKIVVKKVTNPATSTQTFTFTPSYNGGTTFDLANGQSNDSGFLKPGSYKVSEGAVAGWDLKSSTCDNANNPSTITLGAGKTVTCTFTNVKRGKVKVIKTVKGAPPSGTQAFTFQLRVGASATQSGTAKEALAANAANGGVLNFTTLLVPGDHYQLCESVMPGWLSSLGPDPLVPESFTPPDGLAPNPNVDNSVVCVDFTVQPDETKTFAVDNTPPPGGRALTIGFWKNWASCSGSNGGQKPALDQTLAKAESAGIKVGTLTLHGSTATPNVAPDCLKAVRLLTKSTIDTGKKMASDPIFNMAAQYVAAQLNVAAGAGTNGSVLCNIGSAQALMVAVNFDGKNHNALTAAQTAKANQLAGLLDDYNNDRSVTICVA